MEPFDISGNEPQLRERITFVFAFRQQASKALQKIGLSI